MVLAGRMRTLVLVEHKTREKSDVTGDDEQWEKFCQLWCRVRTQPGIETIEGKQQVAEDLVVLETHWSVGVGRIDAQMQAVLPDGRRLGIRSAVNENEMNRTLILTCVVRAAA